MAGPRGASVFAALGKDWTVLLVAEPVRTAAGSEARLPSAVAASRGRRRPLARLSHALSLLNTGSGGGSSPPARAVAHPAACWWAGACPAPPLCEAPLPPGQSGLGGATRFAQGRAAPYWGKNLVTPKPLLPLLIPWCPHKAGRQRSPDGGTRTRLLGAGPGPRMGTAGRCLCGRSFCERRCGRDQTWEPGNPALPATSVFSAKTSRPPPFPLSPAACHRIYRDSRDGAGCGEQRPLVAAARVRGAMAPGGRRSPRQHAPGDRTDAGWRRGGRTSVVRGLGRQDPTTGSHADSALRGVSRRKGLDVGTCP